MSDETFVDPPRCAGKLASGARCTSPARLGSRYCKRHVAQAPVEPVAYLVECMSTRPTATRVHLRYTGSAVLLCTGSLARHLLGPEPGARPCPRCRRLALAAVARGELEPDTLRRFDLGEPNVDEARA